MSPLAMTPPPGSETPFVRMRLSMRAHDPPGFFSNLGRLCELSPLGSSAPGRTHRALPLVHGWPVLQPKRVEPLLIILCAVDLFSCASGLAVSLPLVRQLLDRGPFVFSLLLSRGSTVLVFGVLVGAIVKQLGIDLHKQLHGIVNHSVNCPAGLVSRLDHQ